MTKDEAISQVLTTALDAAKKTGAWLSDQVPDVLHQLIAWNIAKDVFLLGAALVMVGLYVYSLKRFVPAYEAGRVQYEARRGDSWLYDITDMPLGTIWAVWIVGGGTGTVISLVSLVINSTDLIELIVAPKVWLLEYAASLVK